MLTPNIKKKNNYTTTAERNQSQPTIQKTRIREATTNAPHSSPKRTPVGPKHQGLSASSFVAFRCRFFICLMGDKGSCEGKASRFEMVIFLLAGGKRGGNRKYVSRFTSWNGIQFLCFLLWTCCRRACNMWPHRSLLCTKRLLWVAGADSFGWMF